MIRRIGIVCQDRNSFGFLQGLQRRLNCQAELIEPETGALGKSTTMTRRQGTIAARELQRRNVDLIVRFTDADGQACNDLRRHERAMFPESLGAILVVGVAVENTEQWLCLDRNYIGNALGIPNVAALSLEQLTGVIKSAIERARLPEEPVSEVTARLVAQASSEVFRHWLNADKALRDLYQECRLAALRADCEVPNELD